MLAIIGDSFATVDIRYPEKDQWQKQVATGLHCDYKTYARTSADNLYIHAQLDHVLEEVKPDFLVIWLTCPQRLSFPISIETEFPYAAHHIKNKQSEYELSHHYGAEEVYDSDSYSNLMAYIGNHGASRKHTAIRDYFELVYGQQIGLYTKSKLINSMIRDVEISEIPTIFIEPQYFRQYNISNNISFITDMDLTPEYLPGESQMINHMKEQVHLKVSSRLIAEFSKLQKRASVK